MTKKEQFKEQCKDDSDYRLEKRIENATKMVKVLADRTIINKWRDGKLITFDQLQLLKLGKVEGFDIELVKKTHIYTPQYDKNHNFIQMKKEDRFFNKMVIGIDKRIKNDEITEVELVKNRERDIEDNDEEHDFKLCDLHEKRSELHGLRGEKHRRRKEELDAELKELEIKTMSLKEIYMAASNKKAFTEAECERSRAQVEPEISVKDVPKVDGVPNIELTSKP